MTPSKASSWCRSYTPCGNSTCTSWIWDDRLTPGTRCRKGGTWWQHAHQPTGKGKGQGHGSRSKASTKATWPQKTYAEALLDSPPGLQKLRPLKKGKNQQTAADLLATTWDVIPGEIQSKLQALGFGPPQPEEPGLAEVLQTHLNALPKAVQDVVNKLTQPIPDTEKEIAQKLKTQVTDLKSISIKKTQLQAKLDAIKAQYASMLQDMQELQTKLTEGQQELKALSEQ